MTELLFVSGSMAVLGFIAGMIIGACFLNKHDIFDKEEDD